MPAGSASHEEAKPPVEAAMNHEPAATPPPPPRSATTPEGKGPGDASGATKGTLGRAVVTESEPLGGKLTQEAIRGIVEKSGDVFGDCYTLGAGGKMKDFKGSVTVKATIGPSGTVNQSEITTSTTKNPKVDACVREAFRKIKFPRPRDGGTSVITFPVTFNGVEQVQ